MDDLDNSIEKVIGYFEADYRRSESRGAPLVYVDRKTAKAILDLLTELAKQQWISVEEKLPEERESIFARFKGTDKWSNAMFEKMSEDVRVVVVFEDGTRRVHHSYTVDGKWETEKSPLKRKVTHWMPNPDLPTQSP